MNGLLIQNKLNRVDTAPDFTKAPQDYFDFWNCLQAFGKSLGTSQLVEYKGAYFRQRNQNLTLCSYTTSGTALKHTIQELAEDGYKIKTINFVNKDFTDLTTKFYDDEFYIDGVQYTLDDALCRSTHSHKSQKKLIREYRVADSQFHLCEQPPKEDCKALFYQWAEEAKQRHFMVVTGHYLQYLEMACNPSTGIHLVGFRENTTGKLWGIAGWEYAANGDAQITLAKHLTDRYEFSAFFWIQTLNTILHLGPHETMLRRVFCGTTADTLKNRIGLSSRRSFKVVLK